jgi:hypothetical protein
MRVKGLLLPAVLLIALFLASGSAYAITPALTLNRPGSVSTLIGAVDCRSVIDLGTINSAFTSAGNVDTTLNVPVKRVQYDFLDNTQSGVSSWTLYYDTSIASKILAAGTPTSYIKPDGSIESVGGLDFNTMLNDGFGVYTYNTGNPWNIDYEIDHITFSRTRGTTPLPVGGAVGVTNLASVDTFQVLFDRSLDFGTVNAAAYTGTNVYNGTVQGPVADPAPEPSGLIALFTAICGMLGLIKKKTTA